MKKYRLCRNKYGYYKIQERKTLHVFGVFEIKRFNKWVDIKGQQMYHKERPNVLIFRSKQGALEHLKKLRQEYKKVNNDWKCVGKVM